MVGSMAMLLLAAHAASRVTFEHGVASGDASSTSVVMWTRVTPQEEVSDRSLRLRFAVCKGGEGEKAPAHLFPRSWMPAKKRLSLRSRCRYGFVRTGAYRDYTVKVEPTDLEPHTRYFYQFARGKAETEVGLTTTLPAPGACVDELRYAVLSCSNYGHGYFHAYEVAAAAGHLDFWIHVGDYTYEYGSYTYPSQREAARQEPYGPFRETVTLSEYRQRFALYRSDPSLQKMHRRAGMYAIWDDHEFTNDARSDGAENHNENCSTAAATLEEVAAMESSAHCDKNEGPYQPRVDAATQAYFEWMPVSEAGGIFDDPARRRSRTFEFHFGDLASFAGYDTRITTRTLPDTPAFLWTSPAVAAFAATRTNVSAWREAPAAEELAAAAAQWKQVGDAELMGAAARERMQAHFAESKAGGVPWQVLATPIQMSERILSDYLGAGDTLEASLLASGATAELAAGITAGYRALMDAVLASPDAFLPRVMQASADARMAWNHDAWDGFSTEREEILRILQQVTNNAIVVAGDAHNAYASELRAGDKVTGTPVAVTYDSPAITSPGHENVFSFLTNSFNATGWDIGEYTYKAADPALKYANLKDKGFVYFEVTKEKHSGEFVMVNSGRMAGEHSAAKVLRNPTFNFSESVYCDARVATEAGTPGKVSSVEGTDFFIPLSCRGSFVPENFDSLFEEP